jgi:hypothetical protein
MGRIFTFLALIVTLSSRAVLALGIDLKGDAIAEHEFARARCSDRHAVENNDPPAVSERGAPSFQSIADAKTATATSLYVFPMSEHERMPQFILNEEDRQNVIAYIIGLRRRGKT